MIRTRRLSLLGLCALLLAWSVLASEPAAAQVTDAPAYLRTCKPKAPAPLVVVECEGFVFSVLPFQGAEADKLLQQAREGNLKRVKRTDAKPRQLARKSDIPGLDKEGLRLIWLHTGGQLWFFDSFEGPDGIYQCGGRSDDVTEKNCRDGLTWARKVGVVGAAQKLGGRQGSVAGGSGTGVAPPTLPVPDGCERQKVRPPAQVFLCRDNDMTELTLLPLDDSKQNANDAVDAMLPMVSNGLKNQGWAMRAPEARDCQLKGVPVGCSHVYGRKPSGAEAHVVLGVGAVETMGNVLAMCKWGGLEKEAPAICRDYLSLDLGGKAKGKKGKKARRKKARSKKGG